MQSNNSTFITKVLKDKKLTSLLWAWLDATEDDKKHFEFIENKDGSVDILDNRPDKSKKAKKETTYFV